MAKLQKRGDRTAKHLNPEKVSFSMFTADDIRKLCVTKITTPLTFDSLGHPFQGGLHDKTLGPLNERSDPCGTCRKNVYSCPGHYGYISLPLPVVNPLFYKIIATIFKKTCLSCYQIQVPEHVKHSLSMQMRLLDAGRISEAVEVENRIAELNADYGEFEDVPEDKLASLMSDYQIPFNVDSHQETSNKNTESLKIQFINNVFAQLKVRKSCIHCKASLEKIFTLRNKFFKSSRQKSLNASADIKAVHAIHITPKESCRIMRLIWRNEKEFLLHMVPVLKDIECENPTDVFYMELVPVTPTNARPVNVVDGRMSEHQQTILYKNILTNSMLLTAIIQVMKNDGDIDILPSETKVVYLAARGTEPIEKFNHCWEGLQFDVDGLIDTDRRVGNTMGLKQIIEKKEGIIRKHMMGKRVNFAARSVITPDPNLKISEIGIPETFAKSLTYPVPVTSWNVEELRKLILNGPNVHPGAVTVEFEDGNVNRINPNDQTQQESILKRLLTPDGPDQGFRGIKMVNRHLINGDVLLLNRQPTLHRPSIMAHTARILKGEKTLRLHYANCKAYNADFDGDEMNAHFPQNELARSEGYTLANVSNQYLVPKDGTPLSGLIQDHIIAGVKMSIRGRFYNKCDYQQLVYQALSFKTSQLRVLPPAILKPVQLWSGKQILSTIILNVIPKDKQPINLTSSSKINAKAWENSKPRQWLAGGTPFKNDNVMSEAEVVLRGGELLVGILDKTHYGATPYSLVHCIYELYGGDVAVKLLSSFSKLFTNSLQLEGFTLGVHDILVLKKADRKRTKIINNSREIGAEVMRHALNIPEDTTLDEIVEKLEEQSASNPKMRVIIDRQYKQSLDSYTNDINKVCLPEGLLCKFPENNLQLMVQSGAKGSTVNTMQISCLLGQIELEGKRPPVMICGKSLPSFPIHEFAPRAGGFIDGRFMTGIQPQEFFFHCMAGREGLIDTAVKTSRSGYLQRCLIKHLEGLTVNYDHTVRDSDKSVIQFAYGEDGMDISKVQFLNEKSMSFLHENCKAIIDTKVIEALTTDETMSEIAEHNEKVKQRQKVQKPFIAFSQNLKEKVSREKLEELWFELDKESKEKLVSNTPELTVNKYPAHSHYSALNEKLLELKENYIRKNNLRKKDRKNVEKMINLKAIQSLAAPGEPVGLLAAQSIGEPSTQMTLNTFHFAGRGEMNVTLGIPRLREILMVASKNLKTPSMEVPFLDVPRVDSKAEKLRKLLTRVVVSDVLEKIDVIQELELLPDRQHKIVLRFQFMPYKLYKRDYHLKPEKIIKYMGDKFFKIMFAAFKKYSSVYTNVVSVEDDKRKATSRTNGDDDDDEENFNVSRAMDDKLEDSSDEEPEDLEDAKLTGKFDRLQEGQDPNDEDEVEASGDEEYNEKEETEAADISRNEIDMIRSSVLDRHSLAKNYIFDTEHYQWCELTFGMPLNFKKLDLTAILRDVAGKAVLWETPGIRKAIIYNNDDKLMLKTDGINMIEMFKYNQLLDLKKLYSNDIHKIAETYGIESAQKVIVKEVQDVFKVYGIKVDPRHLLLIADYMTFSGSFKPLSRTGMASSVSPLQQMSFESSLTFLKAALIGGKKDILENPSSCLMIGKPCMTGTGTFTLLQKLQTKV